MSTYTQIYYHIVFSTKYRTPSLPKEHRERLFRYIWGLLKNKKCHLYRIGGVEDHIHILTSLHPMVRLAELIKSIKTSSGPWMKADGAFPSFENWQNGYGAFTVSHSDRNNRIEYVRNQEEHHRTESFVDELKRLLEEHGVDFEERYLD